MTKKAGIQVGYSKQGNLDDYRCWEKFHVGGIDVTLTDGNGNEIKVSVRDVEDSKGHRIELNGKVLSLVD